MPTCNYTTFTYILAHSACLPYWHYKMACDICQGIFKHLRPHL